MKVFAYGRFENLEIGQKVLVARCGSGRSYFVSLRIEGRENDKEFMKQRVHYWNDKKAVMEYK